MPLLPHEAMMAGRKLDKPAIKAEVERRYLALAGADALPQVTDLQVPAQRSVAEEMRYWVNTVVATRVSCRTGLPIKPKVVQTHHRAALDLAAFAAASPVPFIYAGIDTRFHESSRNFTLGTLQRGPGTFNRYLSLVRAFLI